MLTSLPLPYHNKRSPAHSGDELPFLGDELQNRGGVRPASAGGGRQYESGNPLPSPPGADEIIGPYAEGRHPQGVRRTAAPGLAARMPCIVGRAFTPAGEVCATPEGYWHGKVPHPSVAWGDITGLRCPHRAACAEAHLRSATAALPRSGKDRSGERRAVLCFLSPNRR